MDQLSRRRKEWLRAANDEADAYQRDSRELQEMPRDILYLMGDQWPARRPRYKAAPVNNRLLRSMEQTVAILTDLSPSYEVKASDEVFDDQAALLTKTCKAWWIKNDVDFQLAMAVIYAYLTTGFLRICWNPRLANGRGDFQVYPLSPYDVKPIGPAHLFQDWEGCIYESVRSIPWFRRNFPGAGSTVQSDINLSRFARPLNKPAQMNQASYDMLSPQMQRWVGPQHDIGHTAIRQAWYREFWIKDYSLNTSQNVVQMGTPGTNWYYEVQPNKPLYPRGRLICTGGNDFQVLYDGPNFYWHGKFLFIMLRLKPVPWQMYGLSELRTKIPLQDIVNSILAGVLDMIKKALAPPLVFPDNAFSDAIKNTLDPNMPNAKIGYNPIAGTAPEWGPAPVIPAYVQNTLGYSQNEMDDDSGLLDLSGLARKKITPAGDTLQGLKESQQTIMRLRGRYISIALRDLGEQMTPNFMQFYTLNRRMWMFGRTGVTYQDVWDTRDATMVPAGRSPLQHAQNFSFEITDSSLLNLNKNDDRMLAMALRRQQDMDRETLYQQLDMSGLYDQVKKNMKEEQEEMISNLQQAQMRAQMGVPMVPGSGGPASGPGPGGDQNPPVSGTPPVGHQGVGGDNPMANLIGES